MRKSFLALVVACCFVTISTQHNQGPPGTLLNYDTTLCNVKQDVSYDYRSALYDFDILLFKSVAVRSNFNFVISPISIWIMLAAMAEGAELQTQQRLFQLLNLPDDPCVRQVYYQLATTRASPSNDVNINNNRVLLINDGTIFNPNWYDFAVRNNLLEVVLAPIRYNPVATANEIKRIMAVRLPRLDLNGNSVLLDVLDFNGLWTTTFADATVEQAPFYNQVGEQIGAVDLMRVQRQARMGYLKSLHAKVIELPVGSDERYRMLFLITLSNNDIQPAVSMIDRNTVFEVFASLRDSYVLLDVAIPRVVITSEVDVKTILQDLGVTNLWTDPAVTRNISDPPAFPSSFVQRTTLVLNNTGLALPEDQALPPDARTGLEPILGRDFIANKPFMFGLFDAETYSCLLAAAYTVPTYK